MLRGFMEPGAASNVVSPVSCPQGTAPGPGELRRRLAIEVALVGLGSVLFLLFGRHEFSVHVTLALVALGGVALSAPHTLEHVWGPADAPVRQRLVRSFLQIGTITGLAAGTLFVAGFLLHGASVFRTALLATFSVYLPWALLQQTLFQFHLLGRLKVLLPFAPPVALAALNGLLFALVHLPGGGLLTVATLLAGFVWSLLYLRHRSLVPIALSHAVLGTVFFGCVMGRGIG